MSNVCFVFIQFHGGGLVVVSLSLLDRHGDGVMGRSTPSTRLVCESPYAIDATPAQRRINSDNTSYIQIRKVTQRLLIERRLDGQLPRALLLLPPQIRRT